MDPEVTAKIEAAIKGGNYPHVAAEFFGVSENLFNRWMRRGSVESDRIDDGEEPIEREAPYLDFYARIRRALAYCEMRAVQIIMLPQKSDATEVKWAAWWLEKARRSRWSQAQDINIHGPNGPIEIEAKVEHDITSNLSAAEIESIAEILIRAENRRLSEAGSDDPAVPVSHAGLEEDRPSGVPGQLAHPADIGISPAGDVRQDQAADNQYPA